MNWTGCGWKRPWPDFKSYPGILLEGLMEITKYLNQDNGCHDLEYNWGPPKYKLEVLLLD
jgi:hypothetical protein